jgi:hypothetical protein
MILFHLPPLFSPLSLKSMLGHPKFRVVIPLFFLSSVPFLLLIDLYLFLNVFFFSISSLLIWFYLIFILYMTLIILIAFYPFIDLFIFFNFIHQYFILFIYYIQFWSSFFYLLFFYHFLSFF